MCQTQKSKSASLWMILQHFTRGLRALAPPEGISLSDDSVEMKTSSSLLGLCQLNISILAGKIVVKGKKGGLLSGFIIQHWYPEVHFLFFFVFFSPWLCRRRSRSGWVQVAAKCCWQRTNPHNHSREDLLGIIAFYTMSANTFVDLQVSAAVVYTQVRREGRIS